MDEAMECRVLHTVALSQALSHTATTTNNTTTTAMHPSRTGYSKPASLGQVHGATRATAATPSDTAASFLVTIASHENTHGYTSTAPNVFSRDTTMPTALDSRAAMRACQAQLRARDAKWRAWANEGRAHDVLRSSAASTAGLVKSTAEHHGSVTLHKRKHAAMGSKVAGNLTSEPPMPRDATEAILDTPSVRIVYAQRSAFHALRRPTQHHERQSAAQTNDAPYTKSCYHVPLHLAPSSPHRRGTHEVSAGGRGMRSTSSASRQTPLEQLTRDLGAVHEARCSKQQRILRQLRPPDVWDGTLPAYIALDSTPQLMDVDYDLAFSRVARVMHDTGAVIY